MAVNNTLAAVIPTLYAKGLMALRHNAVMPRLVMNDFADEVRQKGEIIQIPLIIHINQSFKAPSGAFFIGQMIGLFGSVFNDLARAAAAGCDMNAT